MAGPDERFATLLADVRDVGSLLVALLTVAFGEAVPVREPKLRFSDVLRPLVTLRGTALTELLPVGAFSEEVVAERVGVVVRLAGVLELKLRLSDVLRVLLALRVNDEELVMPDPDFPNPLVADRPSEL